MTVLKCYPVLGIKQYNNPLSRLMAKVRGLTCSMRCLLMSATQFSLLYVAGVWVDGLGEELYRKRLAQVQNGELRGCRLRTALFQNWLRC